MKISIQKRRQTISFAFVFLMTLMVSIQGWAIEAYPSNWFVQMNYNKVQVLLRSTEINFSKATVKVNYPGVQLKKHMLLRTSIISR